MIENDAQMTPGQEIAAALHVPEERGERLAAKLGLAKDEVPARMVVSTPAHYPGSPRLRAGRRNPRTLYLQRGDEPDDMVDLPIGMVIDTDVAALIGEGLTSPWHLNEIRLSAEARQDEPRLGR